MIRKIKSLSKNKYSDSKMPSSTYTGYFTSDNEPDGIKNATHNTFSKKPDILISATTFFRKCIVGCNFNSVGLIITSEVPCILKCNSPEQNMIPKITCTYDFFPPLSIQTTYGMSQLWCFSEIFLDATQNINLIYHLILCLIYSITS
jgi:hypothetical protein